ncbi:MAG: LysR family transcriptional regulator [Clostridia bacterium]|nr:LysR family transcriptional regulator [Clostridia bacterium]
MKLEELKAFLVLGQRLNYSVAAEELYITQSTLSRIVIRMEEELGQKLLVRDTHSVTLTDAGKLLLKTALEITKKYEQFLRQDSAGQAAPFRR